MELVVGLAHGRGLLAAMVDVPAGLAWETTWSQLFV
jgi:hypothetical protein